MTQSQNTDQKTTKKIKSKSFLRWEAIIPFVVISTLIGIYFTLFFDTHLKKAIEWAGYKAVGAEVNVGSLKTSFTNAHIEIKKIEVTNSENPSHNVIEIGSIRFGMLWDALLRVKFVINEAAIEQIAFNTQRARIGKVAPPPPPPGPNDKDKLEEYKAQFLTAAEDYVGDNVLGDAIALLAGNDINAQLEELKNKLPSKALIENFEKDLKTKEAAWDQKIKELPQQKDLDALNVRLKAVKTDRFNSPLEVAQSLSELDKVLKDGDAMYKKVETTANDLKTDLKGVEGQFKTIEGQIKTDIKTLETHFKIPKLDPKSITMSIFNKYLQPYKAKFYKYKQMAEKYIPPNLMKKKNGEVTEEPAIQPHPREKGISYEFAKTNSYPLFWVKRAGISSQAGLTPNAGNIAGEILNITSHQKLVGKPTVATLKGDFPSNQIYGLLMKLSLDNTKSESLINYSINIGKYPLAKTALLASPDVQIGFNSAEGNLGLSGYLKGFKEYSIELKNNFTNISYEIGAKNKVADEILKNVFNGIPTVTLNAESSATLPKFPLSMNSNLGPELQKGFEKEIKAKIEETKKKIEAAVNEEIGKQKARLELEVNKVRGQIDREIAKSKEKVEAERNKINQQIEKVKKESEDKAKKEIKEKGKKAVDDLKKKFGF